MALVDVYDVGLHLPAYVSLAAALACVLLLPLYFSQRRDLLRLHAWMEREPGHPAADMAASEALLDRAETELEQLLGTEYQALSADQADEQAVAEPTRGGTARARRRRRRGPDAQRVTTERPALERITTERAALLPHPRWRRLVARVTQPRVLSAMAAAAVVLGLVAIFGVRAVLGGRRGSGKGPKPGAVEPGDVERRGAQRNLRAGAGGEGGR